MNAPATFIHTMNNLFSDMLDSSQTVFLDAILMYSYLIDKHFTLLERVLVCLCLYMFYCELKKWSLLYNSTIFLGFNIMPEGMYISDLKVQSLNKWPVPTTVK